MQDVIAPSPHLTVQLGDPNLGLLSVLRSFLPSGDDTLSTRQANKSAPEVPRVLDLPPIAVGDEQHDAPIESYDGLDAWEWRRHLDLARDRDEPLIDLAHDRAGLRYAFEGAMLDDAHRTEFREVQAIIDETPHLRMRLAGLDSIDTLALPSRLTTELLETALPSLVQFDEELSTDVAWHLGEPGQLGPEPGQLVYLIERCVELPLVARLGKAKEPLFVREVPEEPQGMLPPTNLRLLLGRRVDAEPKCLARHHASQHSLVYAQGKRLQNRKICRLQT
jgi:hypothetical protein